MMVDRHASFVAPKLVIVGVCSTITVADTNVLCSLTCAELDGLKIFIHVNPC